MYQDHSRIIWNLVIEIAGVKVQKWFWRAKWVWNKKAKYFWLQAVVKSFCWKFKCAAFRGWLLYSYLKNRLKELQLMFEWSAVKVSKR